jgi:hypothetical protein
VASGVHRGGIWLSEDARIPGASERSGFDAEPHGDAPVQGGITEGSLDYGVAGTFVDEPDYALYAIDPAHTEGIRTSITPVVDEIARVQFRS